MLLSTVSLCLSALRAAFAAGQAHHFLPANPLLVPGACLTQSSADELPFPTSVSLIGMYESAKSAVAIEECLRSKCSVLQPVFCWCSFSPIGSLK